MRPDRQAPGMAATPRRQEIAATAAELFDQWGFHRVSMAAIAEQLGIAKPSLYHHLSNKQQLLEIIHDEFLQELHRKELERNSDPESAGWCAAERVRAIVTDILQLMDTHRGHVRVFFENHRELKGPGSAAIFQLRHDYTRILEKHIERGIDEGEFGEVPVNLAALAIFGMCNWTYQWYDRTGPLGAREIAETFTGIILNGLLKR